MEAIVGDRVTQSSVAELTQSAASPSSQEAGGAGESANHNAPHHKHAQSQWPSEHTQWTNIPEDNTAQRIMHLLTELGSSNLVEAPSFAERNFLHCTNCTGRLLNV